MRTPKNIAASVRQRLLQQARTDHRAFSELLQYYAMERFLYRLSRSVHAQRFILKGALMLRVWQSPEFRPTMDIDLLGRTVNSAAGIIQQIREILAVVVADGIVFDPDSLRVEPITKDADYQGIRVLFLGWLDGARVTMQIDIGFGDVVYPSPQLSELPALLDFPAPKLLCYSRESAIAEKFEAMVSLGMLNSRMKDFYDIWLLSRQFDFQGKDLAEAIRLTFEHRGTALDGKIEAFSEAFMVAKQVQWTAFRKRLNPVPPPEDFREIAVTVRTFLEPLVKALSVAGSIPKAWTASGWLS